MLRGGLRFLTPKFMENISTVVIGLLICIIVYLLQSRKNAVNDLQNNYEKRIAELQDQLVIAEAKTIVEVDETAITSEKKAYDVLCKSYTKILKINLTEDSFKIIYSLTDELVASKGYSDSITVWLREFARAGMVHTDDVTNYLKETDVDNLKKYFKRGLRSKSIHYRRKFNDKFKNVKMELIPAEDYTDKQQNIYLYVKDID